jgi:acetyltransferase-like isoleucine patch superfamily enzyme
VSERVGDATPGLHSSSWIHPTAIVEEGVTVGEGTAVWDNVHLRSGAVIGAGCIIGEKSYVAGGASVGDKVKVNAFVYVCTGVHLHAGVMVAAGVTFTNDRFPRATGPDVAALLPSEAGEDTLTTTVEEGATLGAGAVIGPGITIGRWSMVGMGSVVTRTVAPFSLVAGNPARPVGWVCRCGRPWWRGEGSPPDPMSCATCGRSYALVDGTVEERP